LQKTLSKDKQKRRLAAAVLPGENQCRSMEREVTMGYSHDELKDKILEMYPEIREHRLSVDVDFSVEMNNYVVTFMRCQEQLSTHLEKKDADECMAGIKCVYLGVQMAQFIKNYEDRAEFGRKVA
jgi:hypothetical protein